MHSGLRLLLALLLVAVLALGLLPRGAGQAYPTYALGDSWEYTVEARLDALLGMGNSGALAASGETRAEVTAVVGSEVTLSWAGDLDFQGMFTLPGATTGFPVSGTIMTTHEEHLQEPHFLPLALDARAALVVPDLLRVTIDVNATIRPTASSPTYPIELGDRIFTTDAALASNLTLEILGAESPPESMLGRVVSTIQWNVTPSTVEVPAGPFSGVRVRMEATTGFVPSPFQALLPGTVQVSHHNAEVGSPVLFQFFANGTEVGNASLVTFSSASGPLPFWQPILIGGLLAIPIGFLLYRYFRERRRGL